MHASNPLFATVSREDRLGFYADEEFQPKALVDFLGFTNADVSRVAGVSRNSVRYDENIPHEMFERLEEIANICNLVAQHFGGDLQKTALWFKTKNPMLGDISPRDMIRFGRYDKLRRFVVGALADDAQDSATSRRLAAKRKPSGRERREPSAAQ